MKCAACNRPMLRPALVLAGMPLGPVCARKVREAASTLGSPRGAAKARERGQAVDVVRDEHTADLFEGVAA